MSIVLSKKKKLLIEIWCTIKTDLNIGPSQFIVLDFLFLFCFIFKYMEKLRLAGVL